MLKKSHILVALVVAFVAVLSVSTPAALANTTKPGWGFGDNNHVHVGPPGQSVRPDGDNDVDDRVSSQIDGINKNPHLSNSDKGFFINALENAFNQFRHFFS